MRQPVQLPARGVSLKRSSSLGVCHRGSKCRDLKSKMLPAAVSAGTEDLVWRAVCQALNILNTLHEDHRCNTVT